MTNQLTAETTIQSCAACGRAEFSALYGFLWKCRACGYICSPSAPPDGSLYNEDYFERDEYLDYRGQQATLAKTFRLYLKLMARDGAVSGRLLEVGCAYGFFLHEARQRFLVEGLDVCAEAVAHGRDILGLNLRCGDFADTRQEAGYDVVCMWDTIEHVWRPERYLARAAEALRPGGRLFLTTGDIGSALARLQGSRWRQIHPPTHLNYFSKATMGRALRRHGLDMMGVRYVGAHRQLSNVLHNLRLASTGKYRSVRAAAGWLQRRMLAAWGRASLYANLMDTMFVSARKPA